MRSLHFGTILSIGQDFTQEGPQIQSMPSEHIRYQLMLMARALEKANSVINPKEIQVIDLECLRNVKFRDIANLVCFKMLLLIHTVTISLSIIHTYN